MITKILDGIVGIGYHGEKALNSIKKTDILGKVKEGSKYTSDAIKQGYKKARAMDNQPKAMATKVDEPYVYERGRMLGGYSTQAEFDRDHPPEEPKQTELAFGDMK